MQQGQRGASYLGFAIAIMVTIMVLKVIVIIWPAYWDDRIINKEIVKTLQTNSDLSLSQFSSKMNQSLDMNHINDFKFDDIAKVSNNDGQIQVKKHYEVRNHLFLNIDLILSFEKSFDQRTVQAK
ncbi:DUF4845 domain-containing protein [Acinetobacter sp. MD2]|uniref:DUF4845 domain-containing protein n=1 Tax=Acinetobacter sp. MD2 TaxID=2600066 RepID=UPI002D1E8556|nr:DUF4845 domain-containing protein [Acinetobacter sp. MD2]MEB3766598.1 DUF4845 domain-containing protein [Acinetobacter sp. MD2]